MIKITSVLGYIINKIAEIEAHFKDALENKGFQLYYQPKVNLVTGKLQAVEALIRWEHPVKGIMAPMDFIPIAEEIGWILPIGEWVLRTACKQNKDWQNNGLSDVKVSVNFSPIQLHQNELAWKVQSILEETELSPEHLKIEITESAMLDSQSVLPVIVDLKRLGVRIGLDDFGIHFSSLSYLKELPIDFIKIDKLFVHHSSRDWKDEAILKSIISMAHQLRIEVIAEGIMPRRNVNITKELGRGEENVIYEGEVNGVSYLASLRPIRRGGQVVEVIGSSVEISEFKKTEELLIKAEKLSVAGQLAKGVAHEIRNPLTSIKGFVQLLQKGEYHDFYSDIIMGEIQKLEKIVGDFLLLAHTEKIHLSEVDSKVLLDQVVKFYQQSIPDNIHFVQKELLESPFIFCDVDRMKLVFTKILQNAIDAMPNGGIITIQMLLKNPGFITFRFTDQGQGISEDRMKYLGEPFFTNTEKGTGLGLAICRKIVHAHGGTMTIQSANKGTIVEVNLPIKQIQ
ncbi:EAL domain-containing protein [Schinkia sp. CFF1]